MIRRVCTGIRPNPEAHVLGFVESDINGDSHGLCEYHGLECMVAGGLATSDEIRKFHGMKHPKEEPNYVPIS